MDDEMKEWEHQNRWWLYPLIGITFLGASTAIGGMIYAIIYSGITKQWGGMWFLLGLFIICGLLGIGMSNTMKKCLKSDEIKRGN